MRQIRDPATGQMKGSRRRALSTEQVAKIREAWNQGKRRDEIARLAGITIDTLTARLRDQLRSLKRRGRGVGGGRRKSEPPPPSEEEIWGRLTREIQATWSDEEREARWRGGPDFKPPGIAS